MELLFVAVVAFWLGMFTGHTGAQPAQPQWELADVLGFVLFMAAGGVTFFFAIVFLVHGLLAVWGR